MAHAPDAARPNVLRAGTNAITALLAAASAVLAVRALPSYAAIGTELDSPEFAAHVWISIASLGLVLAVPLAYGVALLLGVRPAHRADVLRGVLTLLVAWLPRFLGWSQAEVGAWTVGVLALSALFAIVRLAQWVASRHGASHASVMAQLCVGMAVDLQSSAGILQNCARAAQLTPRFRT